MTYLVRTIQKSETDDWVAQLGSDQDFKLPLPVVPRRAFEKVIVLHNGRALEFDLDRIQPADMVEGVAVGSAKKARIGARCFLYVKPGPLRTGNATMTGFTGIRYATQWSDVAG
jgi:hypothetical protein